MGWRGGSRAWMVYVSLAVAPLGVATLAAAFALGTTEEDVGQCSTVTVSAAPVAVWLLAIALLVAAWIFVFAARSTRRYVTRGTGVLVWVLGCAALLSILAFGGGQASRFAPGSQCIEAPRRSAHDPNRRDDISISERSSRRFAFSGSQSGEALKRAGASLVPWRASIGSRTSP